MARVEILFCGDDEHVARALASRGDVLMRWAMTADEAVAVVDHGAPRLAIVSSRHAPRVVPKTRGAAIPTVLLLANGDTSSCAPWVELGAFVLPENDHPGVLSLVSHLTGLAFAESARVPYREIVRVETAGEEHSLESADLSLTGISVFDLPHARSGSAATVKIDTPYLPLSLDATVARVFRLDGRPAAGLVFRDIEPGERGVLSSIVQSIGGATFPTDSNDLPTPTADLAVQPAVTSIDTVAAFIRGEEKDVPWWVREVVAEMTAAERTAALEGDPAWARYALEARLFVYGLRAQAGVKNLSRTHFEIARELCRDLARHGAGESASALHELTTCRASILCGLYGREQLQAPEIPDSAVVLPPPSISSVGDTAKEPSWDRKRREELTRAEAQRLVARGEVPKAAQLFADEEMYDEAIHLYLNVMRSPGDAAPLAARRWGLERAAELYELAGQTENAAKAWASVARKSSQPQEYLGRITGLDAWVATDLLSELTSAHPLARDNVDLHYHYALSLIRVDDPVSALDLLRQISAEVGTYKDVPRRITHLERRVAVSEPSTPAVTDTGTAVPVVMGTVEKTPTWSPREATPAPGPIALAEIIAEETEAAKASISSMDHDLDLISDLLDGQETPAPADRVLSDEALPPLLADEAIASTRYGPSFEDIIARLGSLSGREVIDAWYWLALINLRRGAWTAALRFLDRIQQDDPTHRHVRARADAVRAWQATMRARCSKLGIDGMSPDPDTRYVVRGELGRGPRAVVFRALDRTRDREVALKLYTPAARETFGDARSVLRRLTLAARVRHPNVAAIYDFGELEGRIFVASELVEDELTHRTAKPPLTESMRRAEQLAAGVAALHDVGLIHGAINNQNVVVGRMGVVKVLDLAPVLPQRPEDAGVGADALAFWSAEQLAGAPPTEACDIFSVGAWMYQTLTGHPPYEGRDRKKDPVAVGEHHWLHEIIRQAIHPVPSVRYSSAEELRAMFKHVLDQAKSIGTADIVTGDIVPMSESDAVVLI